MEQLELYVHTGGEAGEPVRVFLCRPGLDDNVAEVFAHAGIGADEFAARLANSVNAVNRIVEALNREPEWDSDTMSEVANILHGEGFKLLTAEEHTEEPLCRCANCEHVCGLEDLALIKDMEERMDFPVGHPERVEPAGECPKCGAFSYEIEADKGSNT